MTGVSPVLRVVPLSFRAKWCPLLWGGCPKGGVVVIAHELAVISSEAVVISSKPSVIPSVARNLKALQMNYDRV